MRAATWLLLVAAGCTSAYRSSDAPSAPDGGALADGGAPTLDGGVDGDVTSCSTNCGQCGHSCLGGACTGGVCQPALVATFWGTTPIAVVADATHVAWLYRNATAEPTFALVPVDLGTPPVLTDFLADPTVLVATADEIFAAAEGGDNARIMRVKADGVPTLMSTGALSRLHYPAALHPTANALYILDYYDGASDGIFSLPLDAVTSTVPALVGALTQQSGINWTDLLVVQNQVFLYSHEDIRSSVVPTTAQPTTYCAGTTCAQGILAFATDGTSLFWIDDLGNNVQACPIAASCSAPSMIASQSTIPGKPRYLTYDSGQLIIGTDPSPNAHAKIYACAPGDCTQPPTIVTEPKLATPTFANATAIYWIADDGAVDVQADGGSSNHAYRVMRIAR